MLSQLAAEMQKQLFGCSPVAGALDFMKTHQERSGRSWVVSAAPEGEIKQLCDHFGYSRHLDGMFGFPNTKSKKMNEIIREQNLKINECLMIGDAQEDLKAATENGVSFLLRKTPSS